MTANEFYGPELAQMRLAERQVLEAVEERSGYGRPRAAVSRALYQFPDQIPGEHVPQAGPAGTPQTRQAALTRVRDAVGVR